jgi:hypothetical protein
MQGVMLTHKMLVHCVAAQIRLSENTEGAVPLNETDAFLSYLPLSHIMVTPPPPHPPRDSHPKGRTGSSRPSRHRLSPSWRSSPVAYLLIWKASVLGF